MPGPLGSTRPGADANLTGGPGTSTSNNFQQVDREVRRSTHSDRPQRIGTFEVDGRPPRAKKFDQKTQPGMSNLRTKPMFKAKRKRK